MLNRFRQFHNPEDVRSYINETICDRYQLQLDAFELTERVLLRSGTPCGVYYCLHGPRAVKFTAIWETDYNRILFYGSSGERFQKTQLLDAPRRDHVAA